MRERVLIAMSGGVDSSVAAAQLVSEGFDVVGITLHLWDYPDDGTVKGRCCAPEDVHDAQRVAQQLGIAHYAFDRRKLFSGKVVEPFVESYLRGETPSPCVHCNRGVKLRELLHLADRLEAESVATGHYARITGEPPRLQRAVDEGKDQSYFLHMLGPAELRRLRFPLGNLKKAEVRAQGLRLGLSGAEKGESQELCFVPTGRYDAFVEAQAPDRLRPGKIVDESGEVVGEHGGIHQFTLGQRRNLGVALGKRVYVTALQPSQSIVQLGTQEALLAKSTELTDVSLLVDEPLPLNCDVAVRYRGALHAARLEPTETGIRVVFREPARTVVPGQFAVFYRGDDVLGGGMIRTVEKLTR